SPREFRWWIQASCGPPGLSRRGVRRSGRSPRFWSRLPDLCTASRACFRHRGGRRSRGDLCKKRPRVRCDDVQPRKLKLGAGTKRVDEGWWQDREIDRELSPVGTASIVVGEVIVAAALP